jgi:hypothetical protein
VAPGAGLAGLLGEVEFWAAATPDISASAATAAIGSLRMEGLQSSSQLSCQRAAFERGSTNSPMRGGSDEGVLTHTVTSCLRIVTASQVITGASLPYLARLVLSGGGLVIPTRWKDAFGRNEKSLDLLLHTALDAVVVMMPGQDQWEQRSVDVYWSRDEAVGRKLAMLIIPGAIARPNWLRRFLETGEAGPGIELPALHRGG